MGDRASSVLIHVAGVGRSIFRRRPRLRARRPRRAWPCRRSARAAHRIGRLLDTRQRNSLFASGSLLGYAAGADTSYLSLLFPRPGHLAVGALDSLGVVRLRWTGA